jgi:hypothetical protein
MTPTWLYLVLFLWSFRSHDLFQLDHILMLQLLQDLDLSYCSDWKLCDPKKIPNCYISTTIMYTSCQGDQIHS